MKGKNFGTKPCSCKQVACELSSDLMLGGCLHLCRVERDSLYHVPATDCASVLGGEGCAQLS